MYWKTSFNSLSRVVLSLLIDLITRYPLVRELLKKFVNYFMPKIETVGLGECLDRRKLDSYYANPSNKEATLNSGSPGVKFEAVPEFRVDKNITRIAGFVPFVKNYTKVVLYHFWSTNYGLRKKILVRVSLIAGVAVSHQSLISLSDCLSSVGDSFVSQKGFGGFNILKKKNRGQFHMA